MRKHLRHSVAALSVLGLALAGCGDGGEEPTGTDVEVEEPNVDVDVPEAEVEEPEAEVEAEEPATG